MNVVIFGGSGFIGKNYITYLEGQSEVENIYVLDIKAIENLNTDKKVKFIPCDVRKEIDCLDAVQIDLIYNFAAVHTTPGHEHYEYYDTNVNGAIHVTEFASRVQCKTIVFTSSISVYGPSEEDKNELSQPAPVSSYGKSKLIAEKIHRQWLEQNDTHKLLIVRPAVIFGPGENGNFTRLSKMIKLGLFIYPGRTDTIKSSFYVAHLIKKIEFYLQRSERFILINGCYPEKSSIKDIVENVSGVLDKDIRTLTIPFRLLKAMSLVFKALDFFNFGFHPERIDKVYRSTNISSLHNDYVSNQTEISVLGGIRLWRDATNGEMR